MKKIIIAIILISSVCALVSCLDANATIVTQDKVENNPIDSIDVKVNALLLHMTLEEKIGQMNQYNGFWDVTGPVPNGGDAAHKYEHLRKGWVGSMLNVRGVKEVRAVQKIAVEETRLGIPLLIGFDVIHGYKTISPIPLAEAASWDLEAMRLSAQMAAEEAAAAGINWTFAPMVDISRDARWGRVMEGAGEDPYLGSKIAVARVKGFQGEDLSSAKTILACAKHFAGYGFSEAGRDYNTVDVGTSTLYNIIFPPFKASAEAGVGTFMNSFNELNGIPATGNTFLQREILKGAWNFKGFVVSDWGSMTEMIAHGQAENLQHAAEIAVKGGSDMDMESYGYIREMKSLVTSGKVDEKLLDDAVKRILRIKFELGLFEDPYKYCNEETEKEVTGSKRMHEAALDMAKKSIVLLKNDNQLLPLKKEGQKIAVIGALADDKTSPLGSWRGGTEDNSAISVLEGLRAYSGNKLTYLKGAYLITGETLFAKELVFNVTDRTGFPEAVEAAKKADVVIMVLGEHGLQTGEGRSQSNLNFPGVQQELLEAVYKANKNIVLVVSNGRPLAITWADQNIPAILETWHLGTQSGHAIAQVLYGDYNPSGKLPMTFPKNVGQVPIYYNHKNTGRPNLPAPGEVFWSHYTDVGNEPLYPFGYGLSYTTFSYHNLKVNMVSKNIVEVSVDLTNTGKFKGKEVVQLYLKDEFASVTRPVRELKGFELVELIPNETKRITLTLTEKELGFYDNNGKYVIEPGKFSIFVGGDSNASLTSHFTLK